VPARILVIEDDPDSLELMLYLLDSHGHMVWTAQDGAAGLDIIGREKLDLILCDIQLPQVNGYAVARSVKENREKCTIPLVAVTAFAMVGDRDKVKAAGFDGYLTKPITAETFVTQVEEFLRRELRSVSLRLSTASTPVQEVTPTGAHLLVIDNYPANLEFAQSLFGPNGFQVHIAHSLKDGLAQIERYPIDLVLSDICMDDGTGYDLLVQLRGDARYRHIPVILITSTMMEAADKERGLALGATLFLQRPLDADELLRHVRDCLSRGATDHV
jgi:two-component system cell cycle response regulator